MSFSKEAAELAADIQRVLATLQDLHVELDCLDALCRAAIVSAELAQREADDRASLALVAELTQREAEELKQREADELATEAYLAELKRREADELATEAYLAELTQTPRAEFAAAPAAPECARAACGAWHYGDGALALYLQDQDAILVARQELSEIAALRCMENLDRFENCIRCPHCRWPIEIVELNCTIFNCGAVLDLRGNYYQVGQHLTAGVLDRLKQELGERFLGCGRQFMIVGAMMVGGKLVGGNVVPCEGM